MVLTEDPLRRRSSDKLRLKARQARLLRIARVMTGEYEGFGEPVKRVILDPTWKACTDGETVWLPAECIPSDGTPEGDAANIIAQEGILAHEAAGHLRYTDFGPWRNLQGTVASGRDDPLIHTFVNIIEDARINHLLAQDFPGAGKNLAFVEAWAMQKHRDHFAENGVENAASAAIIALMTEIIAKTPHFIDDDQVKAFMDEARPMFTACTSQANTAGVIRQARRLIKVYREHFPMFHDDFDPFGEGKGMMVDDMSPEAVARAAEYQDRMAERAESVSRVRFDDMKLPEGGEDGEGEGAAGSGPDGDEDGEDAGGAGDGDGGSECPDCGDDSCEGGDSCDGEGNSASGSEKGRMDEGKFEATEHNPDTIENTDDTEWSEDDHYEGGESVTAGETDAYGEVGNGNPFADLDPGGLDFDAEDLLAKAATILDEEHYAAIDDEDSFDADREDAESWEASEMGAGRDDSGHSITCIPIDSNLEFVDEGEAHYNEIKAAHNSDIRRLANEMSRLIKGADSRFSTHHKRGKLDVRRLWASKTSPRLFKQATERQDPKANIIVLIDASGSMGGTRSRHAADAAVVFSEVFSSIRGVTFEIVDFNSQYGGTAGKTTIRVRKAAHAPINRVTKSNIATPFSGSENSDGNALDWCVQRVRRSESGTANLVFVISDGQPAGPSPPSYTPDSYLRHIVANLPNDVEVFSVGIAGMDTSRYYKNAVCIPDTSRLCTDALPAIRKMLRRML